MSTPDGIRLYARVLSQTATALVIEYAVDNTTPSDVLVCNRLYSGRLPNGAYIVDPNVVDVGVGPDLQAELCKWVTERGPDVNVEYPHHPLATMLRPGERFTEQFSVALPLAPVDVYHPLRERPTGSVVPSKGLSLALGWFPRQRLDDGLVVDVDTTAGRLPMVKASWAAQPIARVQLPDSVPVIAPSTGPALRRQCSTCGSLNAGDQQTCLRCGAPLPVPAAPAGPDWRPTHRVPPAGMAAYDVPGGQPSRQLDGGLPVQIVERSGDWVRVVAWTGWSGWVDGRLLLPAGG